MPDRNLSKISPSRSARDTGDAPLIGKVSRTPISAVADKHGAGKHRQSLPGKHRVIRAWSILFAVLAFVSIIAISVYQAKKQRSAKPSKGNAFPFTETLAVPGSDDPEAPDVEMNQEMATEIVTAALAIRDPEKFEDYFFPPRNATIEEAIQQLQNLAEEEGSVTKMEWIGSNFANNALFEEVVVFRKNDDRSTNRLAQLFQDSDNKWLIDFDSFLRSSSHDWDEILEGKVPKAEVRVFIALDNYYNGVFADEGKWQAFTVVSPDAPEVLYGYAMKSSAQYIAMMRALSAETKLHRGTLEISSPPGSGKRQFQITRVLSENWFVGDIAFDESF